MSCENTEVNFSNHSDTLKTQHELDLITKGTITLSLTEENPRIFDYKKRIPNIFIRDVLRAQLHMKGVGNYNDLYVVDGLVFHSVSIRGTIVGIENNIKKRFLVDDGTAAMYCHFYKQTDIEQQKKIVKDSISDVKQRFDKNIILHKAALMLLNTSKDHLEKFPLQDELRLGDIVEITGHLSIYKGKYYIFIALARREDSKDVSLDIKYYQHVKTVYEKACNW